MTANGRGVPRLIIGVGGAVLIVSLFLPWAEAGGTDRTGWELSTTLDVLLLMVGILALAAAVTGGLVGVFRPDISLNAAADVFSVVASALLAWLLIADFPEGASRGLGAYTALVAAMAVAGAAGDYRVFRGQPVFPRLRDERQ